MVNFRVVIIVALSAMAGCCLNWMMDMHAEGAWIVNQQRWFGISLFSLSAIGTLAVSAVELASILKSRSRKKQTPLKNPANVEKERVDYDTVDIYALPATGDGWEKDPRWRDGPRSRMRDPRRNRRKVGHSPVWLNIVNLYAIVFPSAYMALMTWCLISGGGCTLVRSSLGVMLVYSAVTTVFLFRRTTTGLVMGFVLAVLHTFVFPFGTLFGLIFLLALIGSAGAFITVDQPQSSARKRSVALW